MSRNITKSSQIWLARRPEGFHGSAILNIGYNIRRHMRHVYLACGGQTLFKMLHAHALISKNEGMNEH
jgi:hypothetical protein